MKDHESLFRRHKSEDEYQKMEKVAQECRKIALSMSSVSIHDSYVTDTAKIKIPIVNHNPESRKIKILKYR